MKRTPYIALVIWILSFGISSCHTMKHTVASSIAVHDTFIVHQHDTAYHDRVLIQTVVQHDTVVKGGEAVTRKFTPDDLTPTRTASGRKVPHSYDVSDRILHMVVMVDTDGSIDVSANIDSIIGVVQNLTDRNSQLTDSISHVSVAVTAQTAVTTTSATVTVSDKKKHYHWVLYALVALCAVEVVWRVYRSIKKGAINELTKNL